VLSHEISTQFLTNDRSVYASRRCVVKTPIRDHALATSTSHIALTSAPDSLLLDLALSVRHRPLRARDDTAWRIVTESIQLFATRGYAGTSMRQIAAAAGIKPASIYAHFESKQQILAHALSEVLYEFHSYILDATEGAEPAREQLRRIVQQHVRWQLRFSQVAGSWDVLWEIEGAAENLEADPRAEIATRRERYHAVVEALVAALRPDDYQPRLRAEAILSLCDRAGFWGTANGAALSEDSVAHAAWDMVAAIVG
jgi:AcrR family transcriptional regulator